MQRIERVLNAAGVDGAVITAPIDLYYLTGMDLSAGILIATRDGVRLIVDGRYFESVKRNCSFEAVLGSYEQLAAVVDSQSLAFDSFTTSVARFEQFQKAAPQVNWVAIPNLMQRVRQVKDPQELTRIRAAAKLAIKGYEFLATQLQESVSELELARALEIFWLQKGGDGLSFDPIIAFGSNGAYPHYRPSDVCLERGQAVLLDIGVGKDHYQSDMTRVLFFGDVPEEVRTIHAIVRKALEAAMKACRAGVTAGELDKCARDIIEEAGYGDAFSHRLGHGVGLEVHEKPILGQKPPYGDQPLEANMVITIEPGIYLPGLGGIRLENSVIVTDTGCENLTTCPLESE